MRGVVRWAIWTRRRKGAWPPGSHRNALRHIDTARLPKHVDRPPGTCAWCWTPMEREKSSRANYHPGCALIMTALKGVRVTPYGVPLIPRSSCAICGCDGTELDHRIPLALAAMDGIRAWIRAFLPSNLQWLCATCHQSKTSQDLGEIAARKSPPKPKRKPVEAQAVRHYSQLMMEFKEEDRD